MPSFLQGFLGTAGGEQLDTSRGERAGEGDEAGFVGDGEQRARDHAGAVSASNRRPEGSVPELREQLAGSRCKCLERRGIVRPYSAGRARGSSDANLAPHAGLW
jgi:hypothetical protein